jgi:hypothetical protein
MGEHKEPPSRHELFELDRSAWNLPQPRLAPVGPVSEVWPVHESARPEPAALDERPAAA